MDKVKKVKDVIDMLAKTSSIQEIEPLFFGFEKFRMNNNEYPEIKFKIEKKEIEDLISNGVIKEGKVLSKKLEDHSLSKLLYAVLWKNGDLQKIKHIVEGILGENEESKEQGLVFYQFGKYLTKEGGEPIIDQHVLRAFWAYKSNGSEDEIKQLKKLSLITKKHENLINEYKNWLKTGLQLALTREKNYAYEVDKLLFALGKFLKEK